MTLWRISLTIVFTIACQPTYHRSESTTTSTADAAPHSAIPQDARSLVDARGDEALGASSDTNITSEIGTVCLTAQSRVKAIQTIRLLSELDRLMIDFRPPEDRFDYTTTPTSCLTAVAAHNARALVVVERERAQ